jgi:hypothetical protein
LQDERTLLTKIAAFDLPDLQNLIRQTYSFCGNAAFIFGLQHLLHSSHWLIFQKSSSSFTPVQLPAKTVCDFYTWFTSQRSPLSSGLPLIT